MRRQSHLSVPPLTMADLPQFLMNNALFFTMLFGRPDVIDAWLEELEPKVADDAPFVEEDADPDPQDKLKSNGKSYPSSTSVIRKFLASLEGIFSQKPIKAPNFEIAIQKFASLAYPRPKSKIAEEDDFSVAKQEEPEQSAIVAPYHNLPQVEGSSERLHTEFIQSISYKNMVLRGRKFPSPKWTTLQTNMDIFAAAALATLEPTKRWKYQLGRPLYWFSLQADTPLPKTCQTAILKGKCYAVVIRDQDTINLGHCNSLGQYDEISLMDYYSYKLQVTQGEISAEDKAVLKKNRGFHLSMRDGSCYIGCFNINGDFVEKNIVGFEGSLLYQFNESEGRQEIDSSNAGPLFEYIKEHIQPNIIESLMSTQLQLRVSYDQGSPDQKTQQQVKQLQYLNLSFRNDQCHVGFRNDQGDYQEIAIQTADTVLAQINQDIIAHGKIMTPSEIENADEVRRFVMRQISQQANILYHKTAFNNSTRSNKNMIRNAERLIKSQEGYTNIDAELQVKPIMTLISSVEGLGNIFLDFINGCRETLCIERWNISNTHGELKKQLGAQIATKKAEANRAIGNTSQLASDTQLRIAAVALNQHQTELSEYKTTLDRKVINSKRAIDGLDECFIRLQKLCNNYLRHLKNELKGMAPEQSLDHDALLKYYDDAQSVSNIDDDSPDLMPEDAAAPALAQTPTDLQKLQRKCGYIVHLQQTFLTGEANLAKYRDFEKDLDNNDHLLTDNRDHGFKLAAKNIFFALSSVLFGLGFFISRATKNTWAFWKSTGQGYANDMHRELNKLRSAAASAG